MVAVRVVGGRDESVEGIWCARIRFVVELRGIDDDSRMGSASSSSSSEESPSSCSRSIRLSPLNFMTIN
jgi:hypothetical protein